MSFRLEFDHNRILEKNYKEDKPFYFIQVGANDGVHFDDLYKIVKKRFSKGLVIEPVQEYYNELAKNYSYNHEIKAIKKAVCAKGEKVIIYKVNPAFLPYLPEWAKGLASLDPHHHLKSDIPSEAILEEETEAEMFMPIVEKNYKYKKIDLVQIDVEGYDFEVLKMIDFNSIKPEIVIMEYKNLKTSEVELSLDILKKNGFYCFFQLPNLVGLKLHKLRL